MVFKKSVVFMILTIGAVVREATVIVNFLEAVVLFPCLLVFEFHLSNRYFQSILVKYVQVYFLKQIKHMLVIGW